MNFIANSFLKETLFQSYWFLITFIWSLTVTRLKIHDVFFFIYKLAFSIFSVWTWTLFNILLWMCVCIYGVVWFVIKPFRVWIIYMYFPVKNSLTSNRAGIEYWIIYCTLLDYLFSLFSNYIHSPCQSLNGYKINKKLLFLLLNSWVRHL